MTGKMLELTPGQIKKIRAMVHSRCIQHVEGCSEVTAEYAGKVLDLFECYEGLKSEPLQRALLGELLRLGSVKIDEAWSEFYE